MSLTYLTAYIGHILRALGREEDGAHLAEYVVGLAVITIAVILGIGIFGTAIGNAFATWGAWINTNAGAPPPLSP